MKVESDLKSLLAADAGAFTKEMKDALASVHVELHSCFRASDDETERAEIVEDHEAVVRRLLSLELRHALRDRLDATLPDELKDVCESTIDDIMEEYNELHRLFRNVGATEALQEQYDDLKQEMEQVGINVCWFDLLDGDKQEHYRALEAGIQSGGGTIEAGAKGKYLLQLDLTGEKYTAVLKLGIGGKVTVWPLFVSKKLVSEDDDAKAAIRETGANILEALLDGKTFRGTFEPQLGPKSELDREKGKVTGDEQDGYIFVIDSGQYEAIYSFEGGKHSARYQLSDGALSDHAFVVQGVVMQGGEDRVWTLKLIESEAERMAKRNDSERYAPITDCVNALIVDHYQDEEERWIIEYAITTTTRIDTYKTRPTRQFLRDNVGSFPVPLHYGHVCSKPECSVGKVIDSELIGDDILWRKAFISKAEPEAWIKINDGTYDGVSMGFNDDEYAWDPENPGCMLITRGKIIEDSITTLASNQDARIGVAYEELRSAVRRHIEARQHNAARRRDMNNTIRSDEHNLWTDDLPDWGDCPKDASVPDKCFAYAPADIPKSHRKLPHHFMRGETMYVHPRGVSAALAALSDNPPHGNKIELPGDWADKCKSHLETAQAFCDSQTAERQTQKENKPHGKETLMGDLQTSVGEAASSLAKLRTVLSILNPLGGSSAPAPEAAQRAEPKAQENDGTNQDAKNAPPAATRQGEVVPPVVEMTPEDWAKMSIESAIRDILEVKLGQMIRDVASAEFASLVQAVQSKLEQGLAALTEARSADKQEMTRAIQGLTTQVNDTLAAIDGVEERVNRVAGTEPVMRSRDAGQAAPPQATGPNASAAQTRDLRALSKNERKAIWADTVPPLT